MKNKKFIIIFILLFLLVIYFLYHYISTPNPNPKLAKQDKSNKVIKGKAGELYTAEEVELGEYEIYATDPRKYPENSYSRRLSLYTRILVTLEYPACTEDYISFYKNFDPDTVTILPCSTREISVRKIHSVDIIEYTQDSLLVKAKIYYRNRANNPRMLIGYLYTGLLHPKSDSNTIDISDEDIYKVE